MKKRIYQPPAIKRVVAVCPESPLLAESVAATTTVRTMGHEVEEFTIGPAPEDHTFDAPDWGVF